MFQVGIRQSGYFIPHRSTHDAQVAYKLALELLAKVAEGQQVIIRDNEGRDRLLPEFLIEFVQGQ